jgi:hypothetical protein
MNMTPKYRVRYRVVNLTNKGARGVPLFTLDAWRATFIVNGNVGESILDAVDFGAVCSDRGNNPDKIPVSFTIGGVWMPDGTPAVLDQQTFIGTNIADFVGVLILEYLEPLHK